MNKVVPIPPLSVVTIAKVKDNPYIHLSGQSIRIGYYSKQDGLDCIWLVYANGKYGESTDHDHLNRFFIIEEVSNETEFFGDHRIQIEPLGPK